jgi:hypothetical protein
VAGEDLRAFLGEPGRERMGRDEQDLLRELADSPKLGDEEREAFADMLERGWQLSRKQREWAESAAQRVGVAIPAVNMFSAGLVPRGRPVPEYDAIVASRPLKPPGRK